MMTYDEAKAEAYDKLIPRVGQRYVTHGNSVFRVERVDHEKRWVTLWQHYRHGSDEFSIRFDEFWRWHQPYP